MNKKIKACRKRRCTVRTLVRSNYFVQQISATRPFKSNLHDNEHDKNIDIFIKVNFKSGFLALI